MEEKPYRFKWNNNATSSSIFNLKFGTYSVTVTDANNCDYLYSFIVPFNTSIYSNESKEAISFYPNPNKEGNLVYCKATGDLLEWNLKIRDFSGKLIEQFDLKFSDNNTPQPIPFKPSSGIYFIECYNDKGIISSQKSSFNNSLSNKSFNETNLLYFLFIDNDKFAFSK